MSFNPITNQPLNKDNKTPNIKKEQETNEYSRKISNERKSKRTTNSS